MLNVKRLTPTPLLELCIHIKLRMRRCALIDELAPVHSPLLGGSYSVSIPPLTNMLKFSGYSSLSSGLGWEKLPEAVSLDPLLQNPATRTV